MKYSNILESLLKYITYVHSTLLKYVVIGCFKPLLNTMWSYMLHFIYIDFFYSLANGHTDAKKIKKKR